MPSGGYGAGDPEDAEKVIEAFHELQDDGLLGHLGEWTATYVAARLQGASPSDAARAAYTEWDL